jgi:hypothetical protein
MKNVSTGFGLCTVGLASIIGFALGDLSREGYAASLAFPATMVRDSADGPDSAATEAETARRILSLSAALVKASHAKVPPRAPSSEAYGWRAQVSSIMFWCGGGAIDEWWGAAEKSAVNQYASLSPRKLMARAERLDRLRSHPLLVDKVEAEQNLCLATTQIDIVCAALDPRQVDDSLETVVAALDRDYRRLNGVRTPSWIPLGPRPASAAPYSGSGTAASSAQTGTKAPASDCCCSQCSAAFVERVTIQVELRRCGNGHYTTSK